MMSGFVSGPMMPHAKVAKAAKELSPALFVATLAPVA
jgi:hypothetical protein